jgi:hypothetical protein
MQQVSRVQQDQIPLEIQGIAAAYQLGSPQKSYRPQKQATLYRFVGFCGLTVGSLIVISFFMTYSALPDALAVWQILLIPVVGVTWLLLGFWILFSSASRANIFVCPAGLIYVRRKAEVIRWDQIERIWKDIRMSKQTVVERLYTLRRSDDTLFLFTSELQDVEKLGQLVEEEVTRRLLPRAIAVYRAGAPVVFDEVVVSVRGIGIKEGRRLLYWDDLAKIDVDETTCTFYKVGEQGKWATIMVASIPNVKVLVGLIEYARRERERYRSPHFVAYHAGLTVLFGQLSVSMQGVDIGDGTGILPWSEIAGIGIGEREVIIRKKSRNMEWYALPIWQVKDVAELKELVDYIVRGKA